MYESTAVVRTTRLTRQRHRRVFAGVFAGLARFSGLHRWLLRAIFAGSVVMTGGLTLLLYFVAAFVMPEDGETAPSADVTGPTLRRSNSDRLVAGVCAGIAMRFGLDTSVVRLLWVLASFGSLGIAVALYAILAFALPPARAQLA